MYKNKHKSPLTNLIHQQNACGRHDTISSYSVVLLYTVEEIKAKFCVIALKS